MIDYYFDNYSGNKPPSINDFCNYDTFSMIRELLANRNFLKTLKLSGKRVPVTESDTQPDRRSKKLLEVLDITLNKAYTEAEQQEKFADWRKQHEYGDNDR